MSNTENVGSLSTDCIIFGFDAGELKVLLIKKEENPIKDKWSLPGAFIRQQEDLDIAATAVLKNLTGLSNVFLEQLYTFGNVDRHPTGRVVSIAYYSLIKAGDYNPEVVVDSKGAMWHSVSHMPQLVFDHNKMVGVALTRLKNEIKNRPIGFELLSRKFTLTELQNLYEVILHTTLDKRNFRKKILGMGLLIKLDEYQRGAAHRAARLFKFDSQKYQELSTKGFTFEL